MMGESQPEPTYLKYSTETGYFLQDEPGTDPKTFDFVSHLTSFMPTIHSYLDNYKFRSYRPFLHFRRHTRIKHEAYTMAKI
jgi:hypothetical protein